MIGLGGGYGVSLMGSGGLATAQNKPATWRTIQHLLANARIERIVPTSLLANTRIERTETSDIIGSAYIIRVHDYKTRPRTQILRNRPRGLN